jgi:ABC-type antimicrobial peptide transport system permease subunit
MTLHSLFHRFLNLFHKNHLERELHDELSTHLQLHNEDNLKSGMSPEQARRQALLKLGGLEQTKEQIRDQQSLPLAESLLRDAHYAFRLLKKSPAFTTIAILTLALGIGANTAIFSVVNSVLLRSLPFAHPNQLVGISARSSYFDFPNLGLSLPDIADVRATAKSFSAISAFNDSPKELAGEKNSQRLESTAVTEDFFPLLGIQPIHGRTFTNADMQPGVNSVILSYELWRDNFGADSNAIGKTITLDARPHTIIGVMPSISPLGFATDSKLWTAFLPTKEQLADRGNHAYSVMARLTPRTTLPQAQSELDTISANLAATYPGIDKGWSIHTQSLKQFLLGDARAPLAILFCAVGFVLLIACANVSNLFLARGWARQREFAIRSAIGASRGALLRQLLVESLLIALAGGATAFLIAAGTLQALRSALPPEIPRLDQIQISPSVAWFTIAASLLAALLSGLAPAFLTTRGAGSFANSSSEKKEHVIPTGEPRRFFFRAFFARRVSEWRNPSSPRPPRAGFSLDPLKQTTATPHNFLRQSLVIAEIALASILLIGATLALRSFSQLLHMDLGFHPQNVLTLRLDFPKFRFPTPDPAITFVQQVLETTRATPGVDSASVGLVFPMSDEVAETTFVTEATSNDPNQAQQSALANRVAPDFYKTLGIPLLAGRDFTPDDSKGKSPVFIINETLAKKYFGGLDAVGKRFATDFPDNRARWGQIIGVAGNVAEANHFDPEDQPKPQIYAPFYQTPRLFGVYLMVHSKSDPLALVPALQDRIWSIDKTQPITAVATLDQRIAEVNASPRSQTLLLGIFAALGFLLALIGVYGVMSYLVSLQTREIGIRMALGAAPHQVLRQILSHGLKLTTIGVIIGTLCGLALTRFMSSLLFGISNNDPTTYVAVAALLIFVAAAACLIPARRASQVSPTTALRYE